MTEEKIVTVSEGKILKITDSLFEYSYPKDYSQMEAVQDLVKTRTNYSYVSYIEQLEIALIGMLRRHPEDKEYLRLMHPDISGLEFKYLTTKIKTRTEEEKKELIKDILADQY